MDIDYLSNKVTQLDVEVSNLLWQRKRDFLGYWNFDSFDDLLLEVAKQEMRAGPWCYWVTRVDTSKPLGAGNLELVKVEDQIDKANVSLPAMQVTEVPTWEG